MRHKTRSSLTNSPRVRVIKGAAPSAKRVANQKFHNRKDFTASSIKGVTRTDRVLKGPGHFSSDYVAKKMFQRHSRTVIGVGGVAIAGGAAYAIHRHRSNNAPKANTHAATKQGSRVNQNRKLRRKI